MDRETADAVHPGADDNSSGTAAALELARRLAERPVRRSVLIASFDAEELGMIGRLRDARLFGKDGRHSIGYAAKSTPAAVRINSAGLRRVVNVAEAGGGARSR